MKYYVKYKIYFEAYDEYRYRDPEDRVRIHVKFRNEFEKYKLFGNRFGVEVNSRLDTKENTRCENLDSILSQLTKENIINLIKSGLKEEITLSEKERIKKLELNKKIVDIKQFIKENSKQWNEIEVVIEEQ